MRKLRDVLLLLGILLFVAIFGFALYKLITIYAEYQQGEEAYEELEDFVEKPQETEEDPEGQAEKEPDKEKFQVDFDGLKAVNPDVVAWIVIPGLDVSYPVVQGEDNAYYLHHLFTGEANSSGSIFVDCHNQPDFMDQNTIIYGHNMKNGSMFGTLDAYQDAAFWEDNPCFSIYVPGMFYEYRIFSCYAGKAGGTAYTYEFPEADDFKGFLEDIIGYAGYQTGVTVTEKDQVVTLSTCVNSSRSYRYIVHGKLEQRVAN